MQTEQPTRGGAREGAGRPSGTTKGRNVQSYTYAMTPESHAEIMQRCKDQTEATGTNVTRGQLVASMLNATRK